MAIVLGTFYFQVELETEICDITGEEWSESLSLGWSLRGLSFVMNTETKAIRAIASFAPYQCSGLCSACFTLESVTTQTKKSVRPVNFSFNFSKNNSLKSI